MVIMKVRHHGLRLLYERGDSRLLNQNQVPRIRRLLAMLSNAQQPDDMRQPGLQLHRLTGNRAGHWAISVSGNRRMTFRFEDAEAVDVDLHDYH